MTVGHIASPTANSPAPSPYLRFWHGVALDADQVAELYALRIDPTPAPMRCPR